MVVDSGMQGELKLSRGLFERLIAEMGIKTYSCRFVQGLDPVNTSIARIPVLKIGGIRLENLLAECSVTESSFLGLGFIKRAKTTFDFPHNRFYFASTDYLKQTPTKLVVGFSVELVGDLVKVSKVDQGTPAEKSGILKGDVILSVEGEKLIPNLDFFYDADDELFPKKKITVVFLRNGVVQSVIFTPFEI